ncbi:hypothetical protein [Allorhodopirellula solitaria]|uniref:hypothetical protein n=1 Tax=Allorhodopirellula solitaria TaxID=2527987 RepID=UPI001FECF69E|nr:hypothetical protein [Allorhodopirellula solitaria]
MATSPLQAPYLRTREKMEKEVNVLALVKGEEKFIFLFDDGNRDETLRQLARFAANPELDFSWYDAAMLSRKIRETVFTDYDEVGASEEFDSISMDDFA